MLGLLTGDVGARLLSRDSWGLGGSAGAQRGPVPSHLGRVGLSGVPALLAHTGLFHEGGQNAPDKSNGSVPGSELWHREQPQSSEVRQLGQPWQSGLVMEPGGGG